MDIRYIPSFVPLGLQNATALVLREEMTRRLSKLKSLADWGAMVEELSASKGSAGPVRFRVLTRLFWR